MNHLLNHIYGLLEIEIDRSLAMCEDVSGKSENVLNAPGSEADTTGSGNDKTTNYIFQPGYTIQNRYPVSQALISMHRGRKPANARNTFTPDEILRYAAPSK